MTLSLQKCQTNELLFIGFNQDAGCFACGTDTGFRIYNSDPFKETFERDFKSGGLGYVEMLYRCNILALIGGGTNPRFPASKVMIWDDHQNRCIGELSFRSEVRAVRLRRDRVVVVLEHKIYVYNFADLKLLDQFETTPNTRGLCELCPLSTNNVLVSPGLQKGHVRVQLYDQRRTVFIEAHENALVCMALNQDGTRVATASESGTLIRVFDTSTGRALQELRRGVDRAEILSIAFHPNGQWLAVSSDRATIHIYALQNGAGSALPGADGSGSGSANNDGSNTYSGASSSSAPSATSSSSSAGPSANATSSSSLTATPTTSASSSSSSSSHASATMTTTYAAKSNPTSSLSFMKSFLPKYFSSEWSFAQFRVPDARSIVAFGQENNSIVVVTSEGRYYHASFDPEAPGQECRQNNCVSFLRGGAEAK